MPYLVETFLWGIDSANLLANSYQPSSSLAQMEKDWIKVEDAKHEGAFFAAFALRNFSIRSLYGGPYVRKQLANVV